MAEHVNVMISEDEIQKRIRELGEQISNDYKGESVFLLITLRGACTFGCELAKRITVPVTMDYIMAQSYGSETVSSGEVKVILEPNIDMKDRHVIIVEDIVDTGYTLVHLRDLISQKDVASLKICCLLDKPERREVEISADYTGFSIPDEFVVGYGLDYDQKYRNYPYVGSVSFD